MEKQKREFIAKEQNRLKKLYSFDGSLFSKVNLNDSMQDIKNHIATIEKRLRVEKQKREFVLKEQKQNIINNTDINNIVYNTRVLLGIKKSLRNILLGM